MDQQFAQETWPYAGSSGPPSPSAGAGPVDTVLYRNLVEMVPLVQSLMDNRPKKSLGRYATMVFTPNPVGKTQDTKARKTPQSTRGIRARAKESLQSENGRSLLKNSSDQFPDGENGGTERNNEFRKLKSYIEDLEKKLAEKDEELAKSCEKSASKMEEMESKLEQMIHHIEEKDGLIKAAHLQLCHKKNELTDAKLQLRKTEEDAKTSQEKAKKLEDELNILKCQIATFAYFLDSTEGKQSEHETESVRQTTDTISQYSDMGDTQEDEESTFSYIDKEELQEIEEAKRKYLAAVITARNNPGEESLALAAGLRLQLQQFLQRPSLDNSLSDQLAAQAVQFPR